ncbi:MAG: hypothetical protein ACW97P_04620 [Candidatus Hodarchaeales archaeon]|jgi:hypothetical protein
MKKIVLQSGKRSGKWKYQLRLLKKAWKNNKTTASYSGKFSKINFMVK